MHAKMEQACELGRGQNAVVNLYYKLVYFNIFYQIICLKFSLYHSTVLCLLLADHLGNCYHETT